MTTIKPNWKKHKIGEGHRSIIVSVNAVINVWHYEMHSSLISKCPLLNVPLMAFHNGILMGAFIVPCLVCYSWGLPIYHYGNHITIKSHWVWAFAGSGSNVSYCKEYKEETSLLQRNCLPAQLYMLTFTCMNKSRPQFYYSIPVRHHLWLSKKWNATETSDHPRGSATEAKRTHENIREETFSYPETPKRGSYNLDHNQQCRKKNVTKLITAAKNNL